jgi:alkaline phosphatase D
MRKLLIIFLSLTLLAGCTSKKEIPYLVVFSFDGFGYNYPDSIGVPNLTDMAKNGVKAAWMIPVFPTVTFPNHYAIATGLYPEHNGITNNKFYNSTLEREYDYRNPKNTGDSSFYKGIPLWNYLREHNIQTATCNWVGSDAPIHGKKANYNIADQSLPFKNRMDTVVKWLQLPAARRPHFIMAYFPEPDHTGHSYGPFSKSTLLEVQSMDTLLGYFTQQVRKLNIGNRINIIVLSDHGMASADSTKNIFIEKSKADKLIDRIEGGNQTVFVYVKKGMQQEFLAYLKPFEHLKVWSRSDFPGNWHLHDTATVPGYILLADEGYNIHMEGQKSSTRGSHGYNNTIQSMQTIFYASGDVFKHNYIQQPFENVDVFPLICKIFHVEAPKNDGNIKNVEGMLSTPGK